jgi:TnsA-like endonuclease N terminal
MSSSFGNPAGRVQLRYRCPDGVFADTTLERVVVEDVVAGLPVREFRWYKGRRHYSGWYWSSTMGRLVAYESRLELARLILADQNRDVVGIAAQPFWLTGSDRGHSRRHVPDFLLVDQAGGVTVVDVKPTDKLSEPTVQAVFAWMREVAGWRGWGFEAWSGADRRLLDNIGFLAGYRRAAVIAAELIPVVLAAARGQPSIGAIERALSSEYPPALIRPVVLHLVWQGRLEADLASPLSPDAVVRPREEAAT